MIETTITKIQYDADGVQRRWSIPFQYADAKHISIYTKVGDEPTVKVVDNYDIDEDDSVVIYPTIASGQEPVAAGTKIIIARETPETQLEDASQVHFTSKDVERGLDKLTMITQELSTTAGETMEVSAAAFESAEEAVSTANEANATAGEAKTLAAQAVSVANDANATATTANTKSDTAIKTANDANEKSTAAVSTANAAKTVAGEANSTANNANATAIEAKEIAAAANATANNAEKTANEADKKADNAVIVANNAKSIAEGIDSKATQALDNSNTAINTANSAKQTAENIDSKATQALANSTTALETATEAKNTADSYQGQITTIESKIPDDATEQNQLVTKTQMDDAIANAGSSVDLTGYYNRDNLLGADEIEIVEEPVEGGIDNNTIGCWHFDENLNPTILNGDISKFNITTASSTVQTSQFRFPTGALYLNGAGAYFTSIISNVDFFSNDFTIDFWFRVTTDTGNTIFGLSNKTSHDVRSFPFKLGYGASGYYGDIKLKINNTLLNGSILSTSTWYHIATIFKYIDKSISVFVDGEKYGDTITLDSLPSNANNISLYTPSLVGEYIDELRISDIARPLNPDGKFPVPTKPYSVAVPTGNYLVRNKTKLVHKSDIGVANGVASLDANTKVPENQLPDSVANQAILREW